MGYGRGDSFPFNFEPNGIPFASKGKLSPRPYPIQCERKWKYGFLSEVFRICAFRAVPSHINIEQISRQKTGIFPSNPIRLYVVLQAIL